MRAIGALARNARGGKKVCKGEGRRAKPLSAPESAQGTRKAEARGGERLGAETRYAQLGVDVDAVGRGEGSLVEQREGSARPKDDRLDH